MAYLNKSQKDIGKHLAIIKNFINQIISISMICVRHHTFLNQKYGIFNQDNLLMIGKSQINPKYRIPYSIESIITWSFNDSQQLQGFEMIINGKKKWFDMSPHQTFQLMQILNGRFLYRNIQAFYQFLYIIGVGSFSKVIKVFHNIEKQFYACKILKLTQFDVSYNLISPKDFKNEFSILQSLDHPNIIKVKEVYLEDKQIWLITDLVEGGTLKEYLEKLTEITQFEVYVIMKQILNIVQYLHSKGYVHRDIKPENILLSQYRDPSKLYMIDFGLTAKKEDVATRYPNCGTPGYIAPEVINFDPHHPYDELSDIFSCGVLLHKIIYGTDLFDGSFYSEVYFQNQQFRLEQEQFDYNEFEPLLKGMLRENPNTRLTATQALEMLEQIVANRKDVFEVEVSDSEVQQVRTVSIQTLRKLGC
ncbi:unnamed protein product (macronuclear) [Paramecium tetraurelia]|uniref:Protein kinase domain-containing protein n=1 Tax=Paramecium tetraurelia TaxID=5888 RepID=A0BFB2_PARTE|nr:uncharacterized protein GSPATT00028264001 [Paramecium tetraurelia]CAK57229.1 unnamed protein product [Paramecium tetraurelia]|eukprot:XP_001424627.1 hypothetical protein (macronuclear) [Paramecium tetraurelia strain d4-2]